MKQSRFNDFLDNLIGNIPHNKIAVAVSGGVDSIALLHLVSNWSKLKNQSIKLVVLSVDHNIRLESRSEVEFVSKIAHSLDHEFHSLSWDEGRCISSGVQEKARSARYDLMTKKCHQLGIKLLLTAHHKDDIIENYVMRKVKKSGAFGLSYSTSYFHNNIQVIRPLIIFDKSSLLEYLYQSGYEFIEDLSNYSNKYERNRVRKRLTDFSKEEKSNLLNDIEKANIHAQHLNEKLIKFLAENVFISNNGFALVDLQGIKNQIFDIQVQSISYLLTIISGKINLPRYRNVSNLLNAINHDKQIDSTLHGCRIVSKMEKILFYREISQINNNIQKEENYFIWDNRFMIRSDNFPNNCHIAAMSQSEYISIKSDLHLKKLEKMLDFGSKSVLFTLPVIKKLEKIVAIPHISHYDSGEFFTNSNLEIIFRPNFISRFTHFL